MDFLLRGNRPEYPMELFCGIPRALGELAVCLLAEDELVPQRLMRIVLSIVGEPEPAVALPAPIPLAILAAAVLNRLERFAVRTSLFL